MVYLWYLCVMLPCYQYLIYTLSCNCHKRYIVLPLHRVNAFDFNIFDCDCRKKNNSHSKLLSDTQNSAVCSQCLEPCKDSWELKDGPCRDLCEVQTTAFLTDLVVSGMCSQQEKNLIQNG